MTSSPSDIRAERALLGAALSSIVAYADGAAVVQADDFYSDQHRAVWRGLEFMCARGLEPDVMLLEAELKEHGLIEQAGGLAYLMELACDLPDVANAEHYANIVRDRASRRRLLMTFSEAQRWVCDLEYPVRDCLDHVSASLAGEKLEQSEGPSDIEHQVSDQLRYLAAHNNNQGGDFPMTGFTKLDAMLHGLRPGDYVALAARPGVGKTTMAVDIAHHVGCQQHKQVLIASLEMSRPQMADRLLARASGVSHQTIRSGRFIKPEMDALEAGARSYVGQPFHVIYRGIKTPEGIRARARAHQLRYGLDLLVIDYVQLVRSGSGKKLSATEDASEVSRDIKLMARDLNVPILALCQLNRDSAKEDREPRLHDIKQTGSIEQDADAVILLHRQIEGETYQDGLLILAKQRQGPTGRIQLRFDPESESFSEG